MPRGLSSRSVPLFAALTLLLLPSIASAFKPNDAGHLGITSEALRATTRTVQSKTYKFSERAIRQIRKANEDTDCLSCQGNASFHFDDEAFAAGTARLVNLRADVIAKITADPPQGDEARRSLGGALHTLQDFYAHTNWVELGTGGIDARLGRSTYAGPGAGVATCPADAGTLGGAGTTTLTSGYFLFSMGLCGVPAGKCRHGVPGCSSGLNKDDASRPGYVAARALAVQASQDFLNQILDDPTVANNPRAIRALMDVIPTLGAVIDNTGSMGGYITIAKQAMNQVVGELAGTDDEPSEYLLEWFNDPYVGTPYVTDRSALFLSSLHGLEAHDGDDCAELPMTGLLSAIDQCEEDGRLFLFTDADAKDGGLAGLVVQEANRKHISIVPVLFSACTYGAGTAPPADGLHRSPKGGPGWGPADLLPKPGPTLPASEQGQGGQQRVDPADPVTIAAVPLYSSSLLRLAQDTNAPSYRVNGYAGPQEVSQILRSNLAGGPSAVVGVEGSAVADTVLAFQVESGVSTLSFAASWPRRADIHLLRPDGSTVPPDTLAPGVGSRELYLLRLTSPPAGTWHVALNGGGRYRVDATVTSRLLPVGFTLAKDGGYTGHEGLFAVDSLFPAAGDTVQAIASFAGPVATVGFHAVDLAGHTIAALPASGSDPRVTAGEYVLRFVTPASPFRVVARGTDSSGVAFERVLSREYNQQRLDVMFLDPGFPWSVQRGVTTPLQFMISNEGGLGPVVLRPSVVGAATLVLADTVITLQAGQVDTLQANLVVPLSTPLNTALFLSVYAERQGRPQYHATGSLTIPVYNLPPTCQLVEPTTEWLWPADRRWVGVTFTGLHDPEGKPVHWSIGRAYTNERSGASADTSVCPEAIVANDTLVYLRADQNSASHTRTYYVYITAYDADGIGCYVYVPLCVHPNPGDGSWCDDTPYYEDFYDASEACNVAGAPAAGGGVDARVLTLGPREFRLRYAAPSAVPVSIGLFDVSGRKVREWLADAPAPSRGGEVSWNAAGVHSGVYYVRFRLGEQVLQRTIVVR